MSVPISGVRVGRSPNTANNDAHRDSVMAAPAFRATGLWRVENVALKAGVVGRTVRRHPTRTAGVDRGFV